MSDLFSEEFNKLEKRFPPSKYIYFEVPYIFLENDGNQVPKVLEPEELERVANNSSYEIKKVTAVFKKLNWSLDHEIRRQSQSFDVESYKKKFDFNKYCLNVLKKLWVLVIYPQENREQYINSEVVKTLNSSFAEGLIYYFFRNQPHQNDLDDEEQAELSKACHDYLSFSRKKSINHPSVSGLECPPCPAIIIEKALVEETGWSFEYIRSLDYSDVTAMHIYERQKSVNAFEGSEASKKLAVNVNGHIHHVNSVDEARKLMGVKEEVFDDGEITSDTEGIETAAEEPVIKSEEKIMEPVRPNKNVSSFLSDMLNNPESVSDKFFKEAQKQNNVKK